jgi:hypothetical protein
VDSRSACCYSRLRPRWATPQSLPPDESGGVYFQTNSGTLYCYVTADVEYLVGDLGDLPETTLDYSTFTAAGWTIDATEDGTRFTNDRTGHGMSVSVDEVSTY